MESHVDWAESVFGDVDLGDVRRTARVVTMAEAVARRPAGHVTEVCRSAAEQEAAYRLLERGRVDVAELSQAVSRSAARRCGEHQLIHVAVDQTTVTVVDRQQSKDIGRVRHLNAFRQGLQVMNALAMDERGVPIGLLAQCWWRRTEEFSPDWKKDRRPLEERESVLWQRAMSMSLESLEAHAPDCRPWFHVDRGADANHVLRWAEAHREHVDITLRNACERRLLGGARLRKTVLNTQVKGVTYVHVPASRGCHRNRPGRQARCSVRYATVTLDIRKGRAEPIKMSVVHIREQRPRRRRLEWWLLTTRDVRSVDDALAIVRGYTRRWRIEELHRTWKSGACNVESSQLRSENPLKIWATILAAVATRIERLKHLSRSEPDLPASVELTRDEVDAAIALTATKKHVLGDELTIAQAVALIAQVGGYVKYNKHPPGSQVLSRGFDRVLAAAAGIAFVRSG